jgi:hypothetical protein
LIELQKQKIKRIVKRYTTTWVEMPPEDVERLIKTLQDTLTELGCE